MLKGDILGYPLAGEVMGKGTLPEIAETIPGPFREGSTGGCLLNALKERGIAHRYLSPNEITNPQLVGRTVLVFDIGGAPYYFTGVCLYVSDPCGVTVPGPIIDGPVARFIKRKDLVSPFLRKHGISVPEGIAFSRNARQEAQDFFTAICPSMLGGVCVKPVNGREGEQVHVGIRDAKSFRLAFAAVGKDYKRILVEETVAGTVYRFTCVGGRVIAVRFGLPANVKGDGLHTIAELIEIKNSERQRNPCLRQHRLRLDRPGRSDPRFSGRGNSAMVLKRAPREWLGGR